jgi:HAD superfamily hydrolase (TIGR01509 family)
MTTGAVEVSARAVVFDLDGLLIDSETACFHVINKVLEPTGAVLTEARFAQHIGHSARSLYVNLSAEQGIELDPDDILIRRDELLVAYYENPEPMPGAMELMAALYESGVKVAVASSSHQDLVNRAVTGLGLRHIVSAVVSDGHPEVTHLKPAPDLYLVALSELGVDPELGVGIEDSPTGALAALSAGLRTIVVPSVWTRNRAFPDEVTHVESLHQVRVHPLD